MARVTRRSARLQKCNTATQSSSTSSEEDTSISNVSINPLPAVSETQEEVKEVVKETVTETVKEVENVPKIVEHKVDTPAATPSAKKTLPSSPLTSSKIRAALDPAGARTPKNKTPLRPSGAVMHPEHHHASTATPFEEARWLGFLSMGAHTAPARGTTNQLAIEQSTPTKVVTPARNPFHSPEFKFRFTRPSDLELSPTTKKIMEQTRKEAAKIRASMVGNSESAEALSKNTDEKAKGMATPGRKIKEAKGSSSRFNDIHNKQFNKMDSIANHPSAFRADPTRFTPKKGLKRTQSKAELDKHDDSSSSSSSSSILNSKSTVRIVPPSRHGEEPNPLAGAATTTKATEAPVKRVKRREGEDTSTRPSSRDGEQKMPRSPPGHGIAPSTASGIPKLPAFLTPTKSSMARSQSVKNAKTTSLIPSLLRSPTHISLTPTKSRIGGAIQAGLRKTSNGFNRMKSILRSPQRQFSADPLKIAAGTHMATRTPEKLDTDKALPSIPATAPVQRMKRVGFTASVTEKADRDEAMQYPQLPTADSAANAVGYPDLPSSDEPESPSRRTLSELSVPGSFSFRSDRQVSFSAAPTDTIRKVRPSDASDKQQVEVSKKRKVESAEDSTGSDKENTNVSIAVDGKKVSQDEAEDGRPAKKVRTAMSSQAKVLASPAKTPSRLPRTDSRRTGLTPSRLNFLAMPKRRRD